MNIKFQGIEYDREAKSFILCTYREFPVSRPPTVPWDVVRSEGKLYNRKNR